VIWSFHRAKRALRLLFPTLKKAFPLLLIVALLVSGLEYLTENFHQARFTNGGKDFSMASIIGLGILAVIANLILGHLWILASIWGTVKALDPNRANFSLTQSFHQSLIESLRKILSSMNYTLLLVIPGLIRWVRLYFVIPITLLSKTYTEGRTDALLHSQALSKKCFWPLLGLIFVQGVTTLTLDSTAAGLGWAGIFLIGISWLFSLFCGIYMTLTYFDIEGESALENWTV